MSKLRGFKASQSLSVQPEIKTFKQKTDPCRNIFTKKNLKRK